MKILKFLTRLIRQPLVHFLAIGALIFAYYAVISPSEEEQIEAQNPGWATGSDIVITGNTRDRLETEFKAVWRREPTTNERRNLLDNFIREEILIREAVKLGLDQNDTVIRRRLAQKMDFLASSAARAMTPTEEELSAFYDENREIYMRPGKVAFQQIYLGEQLDEAILADTKARLERGETPDELGVSTMLPPGLPLAAETRVDGIFGKGVFEAVMNSSEGEWHGPVKSGFGHHLVLVTEREEPSERDWLEIRNQVAENYALQQAEKLKEKRFEALKGQYRIIDAGRAQ